MLRSDVFFKSSTNWLSSAFFFSSAAILSLCRLSAFLNSRFSDALRTALVLHSSRLRTSFDSWGMVLLYIRSLVTQSPIINIFASPKIQKQETEIVPKLSNFDSLGQGYRHRPVHVENDCRKQHARAPQSCQHGRRRMLHTGYSICWSRLMLQDASQACKLERRSFDAQPAGFTKHYSA